MPVHESSGVHSGPPGYDGPYDLLSAFHRAQPGRRHKAVEPIRVIGDSAPPARFPSGLTETVITTHSGMDVLALFSEHTLASGFTHDKSDIPKLDEVGVSPDATLLPHRI